jgi:predicted membrane protein
MNTQIARTTTGAAIIAVGIIALLSSLDILNLNHIFATWWPLLVIIGGGLILLNNPRQYAWAILVIAAGVLWQLREFNIIEFSIFQLFWPAIIIAIGLSVITRQSARRSIIEANKLDDVSALLGGVDTKNESDDYQGGRATAILGGVVLDLRHATIKKEATLDVFVLCGGVELKVPEHWVIRSQVMPVLGGIENKTNVTDKPKAPVLTIVGTVALGGVEIKH